MVKRDWSYIPVHLTPAIASLNYKSILNNCGSIVQGQVDGTALLLLFIMCVSIYARGYN